MTWNDLSATLGELSTFFLSCHWKLIFNSLSGLSPLGMLERKCSPKLGWGQARWRTVSASEAILFVF